MYPPFLLPSFLSLADIKGQPIVIEKNIKRTQLLQYLIHKQNGPIAPISIRTSVPIPPFISMKYTKAPLEILIFPYVKESTPWPEKHSYVQLRLTIPDTCLTPTYSCKLVFSLTITAHKPQDELLEGEAPIEITMDV